MVHGTPQQRTFARLIGVLCLFALVFGDVVRGIHLLTTAHVLCAEHGELIHADEGDAKASRATEPGHARATRGGSSDHHHDHCGLAASKPTTDYALHAPRVAAVGRSDLTTNLVSPCLERHASVSVLSFAPKQSPPA